MNILQNNDLRTLSDHYGLDYSAMPYPGYGAVATLNLNCMGSYDADLEFYDEHAVLEVWVDFDKTDVPQRHITEYKLKIKMPIWVAEHIAHVTSIRQKEES
nr:MAG TPA: hypothetical protein [Caudoviricetes sp.]